MAIKVEFFASYQTIPAYRVYAVTDDWRALEDLKHIAGRAANYKYISSGGKIARLFTMQTKEQVESALSVEDVIVEKIGVPTSSDREYVYQFVASEVISAKNQFANTKSPDGSMGFIVTMNRHSLVHPYDRYKFPSLRGVRWSTDNELVCILDDAELMALTLASPEGWHFEQVSSPPLTTESFLPSGSSVVAKNEFILPPTGEFKYKID